MFTGERFTDDTLAGDCAGWMPGRWDEKKRNAPEESSGAEEKKQISYLQGVVTMSDETVKVKEIHASLERIRRVSMLRDRVVELLTRMIEAEQEYIKRLERVLS